MTRSGPQKESYTSGLREIASVLGAAGKKKGSHWGGHAERRYKNQGVKGGESANESGGQG